VTAKAADRTDQSVYRLMEALRFIRTVRLWFRSWP
jgi:hypothetical protein